MAKSIAVSGTALRLFLLSQIISLAIGEIQYECVRDLADYNGIAYEWVADPFFAWKYAAAAENLPEIFQGKLQGTGIFYVDGTYGYGSFARDDEVDPDPIPGYLYLKYYVHRANNSSNSSLYALPAKGVEDFQVDLPVSDDFQWLEQLIEIDIEAAYSIGYVIGIVADNMIDGEYVLVDTIGLLQGEIVSTAAEAAALCSQQPTAPVRKRRNSKIKPSRRSRP